MTSSKVLVTGAAGFIGQVLCRRLLAEGSEIIALDNFSRRGAKWNSLQLKKIGISVHNIDVTDLDSLAKLLSDLTHIDVVYHLAAQVAVTTSYEDPKTDFWTNAAGTFNVAETVRKYHPDAHVIYASTNKVFGSEIFDSPIGNHMPPNPYSPYGVSKYVGELYLAEYRRAEFQLSSTSFRQSCIYGPWQMGVEDQGWVGWFLFANLTGAPITIYGDGHQVRDLLHVDDLVELYLHTARQRLQGEFVVGGGLANALSVFDVIALIQEITGREFAMVSHGSARPGDQPYFVADTSDLHASLDWAPLKGFRDGILEMNDWMTAHLVDIRRELSM